MAKTLILRDVSFIYDSATKPVFRALDACFPSSWTGLAGSNGAGKTTLLKLACGIFTPQIGSVSAPGKTIYCAQRVDNAPHGFIDFMNSTTGVLTEPCGRL